MIMDRKKAFFIGAASIFLLTVGQFVYANNREPGSMDDPIVTLSFVEQRIEQLKFYIDEKIGSLSSEGSQGHAPSQESRTLEVVELKAGERLIASQGTEIILRGGRAVAIDSPLGGLSNVTAATDIRKDQNIPANHLIIVPREDGRGVRAINDAIFMVRGSYRIEK